MLKITEIAFSCYAVTDMDRARKFYQLGPAVSSRPRWSIRKTAIGRSTKWVLTLFPWAPLPGGARIPTDARWRWRFQISTKPSLAFVNKKWCFGWNRSPRPSAGWRWFLIPTATRCASTNAIQHRASTRQRF